MQKKAFTLVEMLIVIVIIGILAAALIPKLTGVQGRARDVARKSDLQQLSVGLASYQLNTNSYPFGSGDISQVLTGLLPIYIRSLPNDPKGPSVITTNGLQSAVGNYLYVSLEGAKGYGLISVSEGGGSNANWISDTTSTSLTGTLPGLIRSTDMVDNIQRSLCTNVTNAVSLSRSGYLCNANISQYQAKYIVVQ